MILNEKISKGGLVYSYIYYYFNIIIYLNLNIKQKLIIIFSIYIYSESLLQSKKIQKLNFNIIMNNLKIKKIEELKKLKNEYVNIFYIHI